MADLENFTNMRALMMALARAMNLVSPEIEHHHEQTSYLAYFIAQEAGMSEEDSILALYAALLHDIGSIMGESPVTLGEVEARAREVSVRGSTMLEGLAGFEEIRSVITYCQCSWKETVALAIEQGLACERIGKIASIVHLSDVVSTMVDPDKPVLNQMDKILEMIREHKGTEFCPDAVAATEELGQTEYVWMDVAHHPEFLLYFTGTIAPVSLAQTVHLTKLMSRLIDYRSPFTAMHSAGVAASARELARLSGMSDTDVLQMEIAGNLHDVGKLAVPRSILEKPGKLTAEEFNIIKEHPYYTSLVLLDIDGFDKISEWARNHHEKLTGNGYPFHFPATVLDDGSRIMAVADIFSAITEERPYRPGMTREQAERILYEDVEAGAVCSDIVALLLDNYEEIDAARDKASRTAGARYFAMLDRERAAVN